jgi:hypothetical protein
MAKNRVFIHSITHTGCTSEKAKNPDVIKITLLIERVLTKKASEI